QVLAALADRLVDSSSRDEMGEALERGAVAVSQVFRDRLGQALEFRHSVLPKSSYCEQMFYLRYNREHLATESIPVAWKQPVQATISFEARVPSRPPLSCRTSPPQGGRLAVIFDFANRERCRLAKSRRPRNLPPCGGDVRQDRGGLARAKAA